MAFTPEDLSASGVSHGFVSKSDSVDQARHWRYLLFTAAGSLKITASDGTTYIIPSLPAGTYFMGSVARVWATGGGATLNATAEATVIGFY